MSNMVGKLLYLYLNEYIFLHQICALEILNIYILKVKITYGYRYPCVKTIPNYQIQYEFSLKGILRKWPFFRKMILQNSYSFKKFKN